MGGRFWPRTEQEFTQCRSSETCRPWQRQGVNVTAVWKAVQRSRDKAVQSRVKAVQSRSEGTEKVEECRGTAVDRPGEGQWSGTGNSKAVDCRVCRVRQWNVSGKAVEKAVQRAGKGRGKAVKGRGKRPRKAAKLPRKGSGKGSERAVKRRREGQRRKGHLAVGERANRKALTLEHLHGAAPRRLGPAGMWAVAVCLSEAIRASGHVGCGGVSERGD